MTLDHLISIYVCTGYFKKVESESEGRGEDVKVRRCRNYEVWTGYTFDNIATDHTISASFAIDTHTITTSAGANGSISPQGVVSVDNGSSQLFMITPAANYHVNDVIVDEISVGAVTRYTFDNITTDHTISASFATDTDGSTDSVSATDSGGGGGGGGCFIGTVADGMML